VAENKTDIDTAAGDSDNEFGTRKRNRPARLISDDEDPEREPAKKKKSSPIVNSSDEENDGHEEKLENVRNQVQELLSVNKKKGNLLFISLLEHCTKFFVSGQTVQVFKQVVNS